MPIAGAVISAVRSRADVGGYAIALGSGLILGILCAAAMWAALKAVWNHSQRKEEPARGRYVIAVSVAVIPWMVIAGLLGRYVSAATLHMF